MTALALRRNGDYKFFILQDIHDAVVFSERREL